MNEITKDLLQKMYVEDYKSASIIANEFCVSRTTICKYLMKFDIPRRSGTGNKPGKNLIGQRFGRLVVLSGASNKLKQCWKWKCLCDCGNYIDNISSNRLRAMKSCGCSKGIATTIRHSKLRYKDISNGYWYGVIKGAQVRNLEFNITKEYVWKLYIKQGKRCSLTNLPIVFSNSRSKCKEIQTASLDRIDSSKGYIEGNVQWVHKHINKCKQGFNQDYFIKLCELVYNNKKGEIYD